MLLRAGVSITLPAPALFAFLCPVGFFESLKAGVLLLALNLPLRGLLRLISTQAAAFDRAIFDALLELVQIVDQDRELIRDPSAIFWDGAAPTGRADLSRSLSYCSATPSP